ncbi:elongator complex protein 4 [Diutina catenulata]
MSFRKRSELIGNPSHGLNASRRTTGVLGRAPVSHTPNSSPSSMAPHSESGPEKVNPGVKPSLVTSQPTVSTGSGDVDKLLQHSGLPLGTSMLIEESGSTDFSSVLLKAFLAQGVMHNRIDRQIHCHTLCVGVGASWGAELPGIYKGSKREQARKKVAEDQSKVSVSNANMKIAWRYGLNEKPGKSDSHRSLPSSAHEHYNHTFDLTEKLIPAPGAPDITYIPLASTAQRLLVDMAQTVERRVKQNPALVIRVVLPQFLNPSIYPPSWSSSTQIFTLAHGLRDLCRQYANNLVCVASLPLELCKNTSIPSILAQLFDGVIHLEPFAQDMAELIERVHKADPQRILHGLVHIAKIPIISDRGLMSVQHSEFAFRNGRKRFEIEPWGIPVDEAEVEEKHTKKNIEY